MIDRLHLVHRSSVWAGLREDMSSSLHLGLVKVVQRLKAGVGSHMPCLILFSIGIAGI